MGLRLMATEGLNPNIKEGGSGITSLHRAELGASHTESEKRLPNAEDGLMIDMQTVRRCGRRSSDA